MTLIIAFKGINSLQLVKMIGYLSLVFSIISVGYTKNLHIIESDPQTGFALYRSGEPDRGDIKEWCQLGIREVMVLSGDAEKFEKKFKKECPELRVIYNQKQSSKVGIAPSFLAFFDSWVKKSKQNGTKILFRCICGCHRTGRLAAYYQMKYQNLSPSDAKILMNKHGKWMFFYSHLVPQVDALYDYIQGQPCSTEKEYCPKE